MTIHKINTFLNKKNILYTIAYRTMLSSRTPHMARAIYYSLSALTNTDVINNITKENPNPLAHSLIDLSMDDAKGTPQHKEAIVTHISNQKFLAEPFYNHFVSKSPYGYYKWNSQLKIDSRHLKEFPVIDTVSRRYHGNISEIYCTNDEVPFSFPAQKQTHPDCIVTLKTFANDQKVSEFKKIPLDEKAGQGMFTHSSRGTVGLLTFDENYENVQTMAKAIQPTDLYKYDIECLQNLILGLKHDNIIMDDLISKIKMAEFEFKKLPLNNYEEYFKQRSFIQDYIWNNIQRSPQYNRSVSFVFTVHPQYDDLPPKGQMFEKAFYSRLQEKRLYNLDNVSDQKKVFSAALYAYKETVDPLVIEKFQYLHNNGLDLNRQFLHTLLSIAKMHIST